MERLQGVQGPTHELAPLENAVVKFSGRSRLYVGNLAASTTEETIKEMMSPYGEVGEVFHDKEKKFAFLKFATRHEAEKARKELNGQMKNGQQLKVFKTNNAPSIYSS